MPVSQRLGRWAEWSPVLLRLVIGYGFIVHGWAKFARGPDRFADLLQWIGIPFPHVMAWAVTLLELGTGAAMIAGAYVALVSIPMACILLVAILTVHLPYGFSSVNTIGLAADGPRFGPPGYEVDVLYLAGLMVLALKTGAGPLSVDRMRARWAVSGRTQRLADGRAAAEGRHAGARDPAGTDATQDSARPAP